MYEFFQHFDNMKVYTFFNTQRTREDGTFPVCVMVYRGAGIKLRFQTGLFTSEKFDNDVFPKSQRNAKAKTLRLMEILEKVEALCVEYSDSPNEELKDIINERVFGVEVKTKTLVDYLEEYSQRCDTERTKELYHFTALKVEKFDRNATLSIDAKWLDRFERDMLKTISINSASIHLRNIRAVFNYCRKYEGLQNYPFSHFEIKKEETRKRNISIDELKSLRDMELKPHQEKYRDVFLLMFYLIGINAIDLLTAERKQVVDGRLEYKRAKTHKLYSVKIEPEANEIIEKYKGRKLLLSFCENSTYKHFLQRMDRNLREIREGLTSYYSRHSWATIAYNNGVSYDTVSAALGHSHGSEITSIYIDTDQRLVDEANRKVLDLLL